MGEPIEGDALQAIVGERGVGALLNAGALRSVGPELWVLAARLLPMRSIVTLLPDNSVGSETVYFGPDTVLLFELVWKQAGVGDRAVDLGTGNGLLAAALATRFDHVVAVDLSARCAAAAGLVPTLNPQLRGRYSVARCDVARGLREGCFDLVVANPPWVPGLIGGAAGTVFAAGGPTGYELPQRFVDMAAQLLAPGGRAFVVGVALELSDGRQPLADHVRVLRARGAVVEVIPTRLNSKVDMVAWASDHDVKAVRAEHVVIRVDRPVHGMIQPHDRLGPPESNVGVSTAV